MDKEHILSELRRTAHSDGRALGRKSFLDATGIRESDWKGKYWVNWADAVVEAGLKMSPFVAAINKEVLLEKAASLVRELGHFPQRAELNLKRSQDASFPSEKVFRRLGTKPHFATAVLEWCRRNEGWEDVEHLCEDLARQAKEVPVDKPVQTPKLDGFVYMLKSGKYYKIGRTNSLDRRQYEIGLQLPDEIIPIHSIATDDSDGIEAYWHHRFRDKRKRGEWFELTREDVAIFKKRKFM